MHLTDEEFKKYFPFKQARINQREIIDKILTAYQNGKHHVILNAPTGIGKSVIAYTIANYYKTAYILTSQKVLQQQYKNDLNIPYMLGKINYICNKNVRMTCELGECRGKLNLCSQNDCPYKNARMIANNTDISNYNYSYFLMVNRADYKLAKRKLLICDQAHNLQNQLVNTSTLTISQNTLKNLNIRLKLPINDDSENNKLNWLKTTLIDNLQKEYISINNDIKRCTSFEFHKEVKNLGIKLITLGRLLDAANSLKEQINNGEKVIISEDTINKKINYKILFGNKLFEKMIQPFGNHFLHMSATILSKQNYCSTIGLIPDDTEYISCESYFPVENRPIYFQPVGSMIYNQKQKTLPKLINKISEILQKYPNDKGIIHTVNYDIANEIINKLTNKFPGRLLKPQGNVRELILNTFKNSSNNYVLISPSLTEGLDLKDDLSRFCIICKVPYASLNDEWIKARIKLDPTWYNIHTAETLVQMTGRSIRSETDHADTYILDSNFLDFAKKNQHLFPVWWKDSVLIN